MVWDRSSVNAPRRGSLGIFIHVPSAFFSSPPCFEPRLCKVFAIAPPPGSACATHGGRGTKTPSPRSPTLRPSSLFQPVPTLDICRPPYSTLLPPLCLIFPCSHDPYRDARFFCRRGRRARGPSAVPRRRGGLRGPHVQASRASGGVPDHRVPDLRKERRPRPGGIALTCTAVPRAPHLRHQRLRLRAPGARPAPGLRAPPLPRLPRHLQRQPRRPGRRRRPGGDARRRVLSRGHAPAVPSAGGLWACLPGQEAQERAAVVARVVVAGRSRSALASGAAAPTSHYGINRVV